MQQDFAKNFIKGKIGEVIFDQMFRDQGKFVVIPFGYDRVIPEFSYYCKDKKNKEVIDNIRTAPDFALVSYDREEVFLVEVKYRTNLDIKEIVEVAKKIQEKWKMVWVFICTPDGFYFDETSKIIKKEKLTLMGEQWVSRELQEKYLKLLKDFIKSG